MKLTTEKPINRLVTGLLPLAMVFILASQNGYENATVTAFYADVLDPNEDFFKEHGYAKPLFDNVLILPILEELVLTHPELTIEYLAHILTAELEESRAQLQEVLINLTLLLTIDFKEISANRSHQELAQITRAIWLLAQRNELGISVLSSCETLPVSLQNLILLNIPNLGVTLTTKVVQAVMQFAMDGREFEGDLTRAKRYGVNAENPASSGFSLNFSANANRNVYQLLINYFSLEHIAILAGMDLADLVRSKDPEVVELINLVKYVHPRNLHTMRHG